MFYVRAIFIENRQDYENPNQQSYEFVVGIRDDITAPADIRIVIRVINIFDNDPTIIYDGPCGAKVVIVTKKIAPLISCTSCFRNYMQIMIQIVNFKCTTRTAY